MKFLFTSILLIFSISCCARPTDYIDGKWYSCDAWTVNADGDTIFKSLTTGFKAWYSYNKSHQLMKYRNSDGTVCKYSYTKTGLMRGEDCSDGDWFRKHYNSKGQLVKAEDWRTIQMYEYDNDGNQIYGKTIRGENWGDWAGTVEWWNEYSANNILAKTMYSTGKIEEFYNDGTIKYRERTIDGPFNKKTLLKEWFDSHGCVVMDSSAYGVEHYDNKYDHYGMIIYEGKGRTWYTYFTKDDTIYKCIDTKH